MVTDLNDIFNIYQYPAARQAFAINKCLETAQTLDAPESLIARLNDAAAHERLTLNAEIARNNQPLGSELKALRRESKENLFEIIGHIIAVFPIDDPITLEHRRKRLLTPILETFNGEGHSG